MLFLSAFGVKAIISFERLRCPKRPQYKRSYLGSIGFLLSAALTHGGIGTSTSMVYSTLNSMASRAFVVSAAPIKHLSKPSSSTCVATSTTNECNVNGTDRIMPHSIGLGTYMMPRDRVNTTLRFAILNAGYRRIDCAPVYFNEDVIGETIHDVLNHIVDNPPTDAEVPHNNTLTASPAVRLQRSDLYLVSKLPSPFHRHVELAVRKTLNDLRVDYLDLYLGTLDFQKVSCSSIQYFALIMNAHCSLLCGTI
jgi:Aldo/keto reductase family